MKGVCVFRCNLPPALLAEWPGSFMCHCNNMGWNGHQIKSQHRKLTLEKKILLPLLPGFELTTFQSRVQCSNHIVVPVASVGSSQEPVYGSLSLTLWFCWHHLVNTWGTSVGQARLIAEPWSHGCAECPHYVTFLKLIFPVLPLEILPTCLMSTERYTSELFSGTVCFWTCSIMNEFSLSGYTFIVSTQRDRMHGG